MSIELINTLLMLGAGQGLFLAVVLATKRTNSAANKLLAVAMVAFSISILQHVYYAREYYYAYPHFIGVSVSLTFLFGPILYLYARTVSAGADTLRRTSLLHFVPFLLVILHFVPFYGQDGTAKLAFLHALLQDGPPVDVAIIEHLQYPHGISYVFLTFGVLSGHRARLRDNYSSIERINLLWLRNLTIGIAAVWMLATGLHLLDIAGLEIGLESSLTPLAVSCLIYGVGYLGLRQPEIFHPPTQPRAAQPSEQLETDVEGAFAQAAREAPLDSTAEEIQDGIPGGPTDDGSGYEKSGLTQAQAEARMRQLRRVMEEQQLFRRSLLTLQELAREMSISAHNLSEVINTQAGKNFYDFVNGYRVEEVMRRLRDPRYSHLTILALAEESGFNSKSTFNACFRRHTGLTPSQYRTGHPEGA